MTKFANEQLP